MLRIVYNMADTKSGICFSTLEKSCVEQYIKMGYTLISAIWKEIRK